MYCSVELTMKTVLYPQGQDFPGLFYSMLSTKSRGYWDIKSLKIEILICRMNNFVFS